ncbi:zinc finger CCCH domain-containing protein 36-like [Phalaenopsis equestris]|uniref:zinc finger CCCH domain-containing protein 36-like n=1 Tax=Phalaenopsis equestris TaxID=78828 RepID=UPI0009E1E716|nr:zinc finger CCCH domain-containing protein 36-like [Phalaenopsis equestris]
MVEEREGGAEVVEEEEMVMEDESMGKGEEETGVISADTASAMPEDAEGVGAGFSTVVSEHIKSEENGIPEILLSETCKGIQLDKEITKESPVHVNNNCLETQESHHLLGSDNSGSLQLQKNDSSVEDGVINESKIVKNNVSEKGESHLHEKTNSQVLEDLIFTCGHSPRRRPRSSSPGSEPDRTNKRLAGICVFYARGWCIKGNSCKFLHQKDGVNKIEQQTIEDTAGSNRSADSLATTGSDEINERSKVSSELLESNPKGSSGCNSLLNRALVRTYGTGSHVTSPGHTSTQEEYKKPIGKMGHFESNVERQSDDAFLSRRHLTEGKALNEISMNDSPYERTISGRTHPADAFVSDPKHYPGSSSISSILQHNNNSPPAYGRTEGNAIRSTQSHFLKQESYDSHGFAGSLSSGLGSSFQLPQMDYMLSRAGPSPASGSTRNTEYVEGHSFLDLHRRYHSSGSISLTRDSSPYLSQPELRNKIHHNISGDLTLRQTTKIQYDAWEPSQPFRSSLAIATKSTSSPSQYDPILDSIEPATANDRDYFQTSQITPFQNSSFLPTKTENAISWDGMPSRNVSLHDSSAQDEFFTSIKLEGRNNSLLNNEKTWNSDRLVERSDNKDAELGAEWKAIDKGRNIKESKALKIFHTALVDFVKELLKPWWREGQLSKDAHKTVVKKSVEKVLSALHSHQIPSTQEAINQYLASSRQKILKLVDGYAQKHANS